MIMGKINIGFGFACSSFFLAEKKVVELCRRERERARCCWPENNKPFIIPGSSYYYNFYNVEVVNFTQLEFDR